MSQYERVFRILGPIIGFALLYYVLTSAAGYLQRGQLELVTQAETAGETAQAAATGAVTETVAVTETAPAAAAAPVTSTGAVTDVVAVTTTSPVTEAGVPVTTSVPVTATQVVTAGVEPTPAAAAAAPAAAVDMAAVTAAVTKGGCGACHVMPGVPNAMGVVGPDMSNIGNEAGTRVPGQSAEQYIHESIVNPNAFTAPKCPFGPCVGGAMPANLSQLLSEDEINTIVQYLLAQKSGS